MIVSLDMQPALKNNSGIGVYTYEICKALQYLNDEEMQFTINLFNFLGREYQLDKLEELKFEKKIYSKIPYGFYRRIWNIIPVTYNNIFCSNADIYHFFDYIVPPKIYGKVITTIHDLTFLFFPETMQKKTLKRIKNGIWHTLDRADRFITVSESSKKDIVENLKINPKKIDVITPGVNYDAFNVRHSQEKIDIVRKKYRLPDKYVLFMGTVEPRKNVENIIKGFYYFKKESDCSNYIKLVIAGKLGWMYEKVYEYIKKLNLCNDVIFTGFISEVDKYIVYQQASIFIFPSLYEGFGIPIIEAMAAGVPVITSNKSSLPEVAGDAAILIYPNDYIALSEAIHLILTDETLRNELILKGRKQAKKFSWISSANKLLEIYKNMI